MNGFGVSVSTDPALGRAKQLIEEEKYEDAAPHLIQFLRNNPQHGEAHALLGLSAMRLGALMQAEMFLRRAIALGHRDFETRRNLASVMKQQARPDKALAMFDQLVAERPDPGLKSTIATLTESLGHPGKAQELYAQIIEENPDDLQVIVSYGHSLRASGNVNEAVDAYRRAIAGMEDFGEAWWAIASIKKPILTDDDINALRNAIDIAVDVRNEAPLNFALARALHDRGQYEEAFEHYACGNALRAETLAYDPDELTDEIDDTIAMADAEFLQGLDGEPLGDERPIFIVSLPRSGSTLLEQIIGSHPQVEPRGELSYIPAILRSFMEMSTRRGAITVPQALASLDPRMAKAMGEDYLQRAALHRQSDAKYFIDKLPHNWSNVLFIKKILPQARFLDIRRPAMDCCFSNYTQSFTSAHPSSFDLVHMARAYKDSVRLMDHFAEVAPGLVHQISYTELLDEPEAVIRGTLDYLGLEWDESVLEFHRSKRHVRTPSSEQVRRPLNRDGMEIWRPYSPWLDPLREELGDLAQE